MGRRTSIYIETQRHGSNPIPAACMKDGLVVSGAVYGLDTTSGRDFGLDDQCVTLFANIEAIMRAAGGTLADIVSVSISLAQPADRAVLNRHWVAMFPDPQSRPARHVDPTPMPAGRRLIAAEFIAMLDR